MELKVKQISILTLSEINFDINQAGIYGIIGKNGIGKSTLFSVLSKEISISKGTIESGRVAYLPDVEVFNGNLSASDYFQLLNKKELKIASRLSTTFGMDKFIHQRIGKYSLGMKQLFAVTFCFAMNSDVLIIDELFSGLDVAIKRKVIDELRSLGERKIVLFTSHHLKEVENICTQTYLLSENGLHLVEDFVLAAEEIGANY